MTPIRCSDKVERRQTRSSSAQLAQRAQGSASGTQADAPPICQERARSTSNLPLRTGPAEASLASPVHFPADSAAAEPLNVASPAPDTEQVCIQAQEEAEMLGDVGVFKSPPKL